MQCKVHTNLTNIVQHGRRCPGESFEDRVHGVHELLQHYDLIDRLFGRL